jgi:aquaporin Z
VDDALRRCVAEFIGAFTLVFAGCGSVIMLAGVGAALGVVGVALAFGLALAIMVSALGHISGGHFNPAVTLGFLITGRMQSTLAGAYFVSQFAGATVAALLLKGLFPKAQVDAADLGAPSVHAISAGAASGSRRSSPSSSSGSCSPRRPIRVARSSRSPVSQSG